MNFATILSLTNLFEKASSLSFVVLVLSISLISTGCVKEESIVTDPSSEMSSLKVGLVGHWDFQGNANDQSESGNHGAIVGAVPANDRFGQNNAAYEFNGQGDHINLGNATKLAFGGFEPYTMAAWIKPDSIGGNIISKWNGGVLAGWYLQIKPDMHVRAYRNVVPWSTSSTDPVAEKSWTHVVSRYDGSYLTIYVNGQLQAREKFTSQPHDRRTEMIIGALHSKNELAGFFKGIIDEVRLYDRDLNEEEIKFLANN